MRSPLLRGEELDDREKSTQEAVELRETGIEALVELTTIAYLGYEGMARFLYWPDSVMLDCLLRVASQGGADRLLIGGDVARCTAFRSYDGLPAMAYLPRRFVPRLAKMGGEELVRRILIDNPARFLGFTPPQGG